MRVRSVLLLLAVAAAVGGAFVWQARRPVLVHLVTARRGTVAELVYASGVVEPRSWAKVTPLVRERIVWTCDCEGVAVSSGALLLRLDDSEIRANLRQFEARRVLASRELSRAADLLDKRVGSAQAFERAGAELAEIEASAAAMTEQANDHLVTAPIAGRVLRLDGSVGEIAEPGEAIAWVGQPSPLDVVAEVNEEDIPRVVVGQRVLLRADAFPRDALPGTVRAITPKGDPVRKTYRVRIALPEDTPLLIGMSVDANLVIREEADRVVLPTAALTGSKVHVIEKGRLAERTVEIGIRGLENAEIVKGLEAGEAVVMPLPEDAALGMAVLPAAPEAGTP